jgi:hypothetical protein
LSHLIRRALIFHVVCKGILYLHLLHRLELCNLSNLLERCVQLEFFTAFKTKYPDVKIQLTKFQLLKPWFIRRLTTWSTCCCRYHTELGILLKALNDFRRDKTGMHGHCGYECHGVCALGKNPREHEACSASLVTFNSFTTFWSSILCPLLPNSQWHKKACLLGDCACCGLRSLRICPLELNSTHLVKWKSIGSEVVGQGDDGKDKKAPKVMYNETVPEEFFQYLKPKLKAFVRHNYFTQWQNQQFQEDLEELPLDSILSCIDFSENYSMKVQEEIQSMHWRSTQISILVMITYRVNPAFDSSVHESRLLKNVHYYVSDDGTHDTLYVQHAFKLHWEFLKEQGSFPAHHIVWSDGCSGQFKSSRAWYFVARYLDCKVPRL